MVVIPTSYQACGPRRGRKEGRKEREEESMCVYAKPSGHGPPGKSMM
jgi:hypothetical protein